jgi:hypothetical protein
MNRLIEIVLLVVLFSSCSKPLELVGFDIEKWETGRGGCNSSRIEQLDYLKKNNDLFIGVDESSIKKYLGRPDKRELVARMGRKYYYYIVPSELCDDSDKKDTPALIIEFEQRGIVKMVIVPSKKAILR